MKKVLIALSVGSAALVTAYLGFARDLITPELVRESLVSVLYVVLSVLSSWLITATVGTRHRAAAIVSGAGMYLAVQGWRWWALDVAFAPWQLFVALIVGVSSPILYAAFRALLARLGVETRLDKDGAVESIKVGDDPTVFIGGGEPEDVKREGIKPEPSNE
jgi:predicted membrane-bound spermidine synthase